MDPLGCFGKVDGTAIKDWVLDHVELALQTDVRGDHDINGLGITINEKRAGFYLGMALENFGLEFLSVRFMALFECDESVNGECLEIEVKLKWGKIARLFWAALETVGDLVVWVVTVR